MQDEIKVGDELYISAKRASEITDYTRDYIGQLARKGLIEARRIGGLWYVADGSLRAYKQQAESYKPEPPRSPNYKGDDPHTIVSFDGREYVSAPRAAEITGYHQDYVGQLAREEKVLSRQIGARWYVERTALLEHKREKDALLAAVQAEAVGLRSRKPLQANISDVGYSGAGPYMKYTRDDRELIPLINIESRMHEQPRSSLVSESRPIAIHRVHAERQYPDDPPIVPPKPTKTRRLNIATLSATVATIVIVVVVGYVSFQSSAIYTKATSSDSSFALAAYVGEVISNVGDLIENIVAREVRFVRPN